jgi:peroxiredoxin
LAEFKGKRVLLINWNPQCGFCDRIAPELAGLYSGLQQRNVQTLFLSHGDAASNRKLAEEYGLRAPILLLKEGPNALKVFENQGTPAAYLLDEHGRVAEALVVGSEQVPVLARAAAGEAEKSERTRLAGERPLSESRIERNGLKPGTPAPQFRLPDIYGETVSLEAYRGRRVLLVFTDPHCGPCDQLAPHLEEFHRKHENNGLALIMVARGEHEENWQKAQKYGFRFPVALQERWKLSKEYGIFSFPVAFLIDEDGVITSTVAQGVDAILALAQDGLALAERN